MPRDHGHRRHNPPNTTHRKHRGNVNISQQNNRKNLKRLGHNVGNNNLICCQLHVYKETHTTHTTDRHTERKRERTRENERERKRKKEKEREREMFSSNYKQYTLILVSCVLFCYNTQAPPTTYLRFE